MQATLWAAVAVCAAILVIAIVAERRRAGRRDPDRVGIMPWISIQMAATLGCVMFAALALTVR